jgi:AraC-like DNA-binding protein
MLCPIVHRASLDGMDILAQVLVRSSRRDAAVSFRTRPSLEFGATGAPIRAVSLCEPRLGDARARPGTRNPDDRGRFCRHHTRRAPYIDRASSRFGVIRHGSRAKPLSTMICGNFTLSRPLFGSVLELLPPVLLLKPTADGGWLEAILRRMVSESTLELPGQRVALSRLTEVLFVEVLRSWILSLSPGQGGWLGAISDPHIGPALKLIHENPEMPWTLSDLGRRVGLGRSAFSARFTKLVGQSMQRYVIERRMAEAAFLLETGDESIARIANRVGYETAAAFSKLFHRRNGQSPGRYRAARRADGGRAQSDGLGVQVSD